jgi:(p)ppGpp synthase/HD superfamily hydrolase
MTDATCAHALAFVQIRHAGKFDPLGQPVSQHFVRVADRLVQLFPAATPAQIVAALLHDALEPGQGTIEDLHASGIDPRAIELIARITLPTDGRDYLTYISDLVATGDREAIEVKLADNLDALDIFPRIGTPEALDLVENRYKPSRKIMLTALETAP